VPVAPETEFVSKPIGREKPEREFLALLLSRPELMSECEGIVDSALFINQNNAQIFEMIRSLYNLGEPISVASLFDRLEDEGLRRLLAEIGIIEHDEDVHIQNYLNAFKTVALKKRKDDLKSKTSEAEHISDETRALQLEQQFWDLQINGENQ
jgi:replicative DNA helicase